MRTSVFLYAVAVVAAAASPALAADKAPSAETAACIDAASKGQTLRDDHKLVEARNAFRRCARGSCPGAVQSDCATWLASVEGALPTVVVTVEDADGTAVPHAAVRVDGQPLPDGQLGEAMAMDPGPHTFHVEAPGAPAVERQVVVAEGKQNVAVSIVVGARPAHRGDAPAAGAEHAGSGWKTAGWVIGGVGVAGLALGTTFGILAASDKGRANCDGGGFCEAGALDDSRSAARVADVGLIAGAALLAAGAAIVLFMPGTKHKDVEGTTTGLVIDHGRVGLGARW
jgi:hypothetical protein